MLECNKIDHDIFLLAKRSSEILNSVYFGLLLLQLLLTVTLIYTLYIQEPATGAKSKSLLLKKKIIAVTNQMFTN